jgi:hypothetical protein
VTFGRRLLREVRGGAVTRVDVHESRGARVVARAGLGRALAEPQHAWARHGDGIGAREVLNEMANLLGMLRYDLGCIAKVGDGGRARLEREAFVCERRPLVG